MNLERDAGFGMGRDGRGAEGITDIMFSSCADVHEIMARSRSLPPLHTPLSTDRLALCDLTATISEITKARMNPRCEINCLQLIIWHRI